MTAPALTLSNFIGPSGLTFAVILGHMLWLGTLPVVAVLALLAMFETIGPPLAAFAFRMSGQAGAATRAETEPDTEFAGSTK